MNEEHNEVDLNEVLRDFGLENVPQTETLIQHNNQFIVIPNDGLEPPTIEEEDSGFPEEAIVVSTPSSEEETSTTEEVTENPPQEESNSALLLTEEALNLLPLNSKSFEIDDTTSRFSGASWYNAIQDSTVILAGVGGIGSWTNLVLSRMKPKQIFLFDDDVVEEANLSGQCYSKSMVGSNKVDAMAQLAKDFSDYNKIIAIPERFTASSKAGDIMICGFDNMVARETFFNVWLNHVIKHPHPEKCLFIDGRLAMETFQVFCIKGNDSFNIKRYANEYLFKDREAKMEVCSMKQTTYCSNMIGSIIVNLFTNFVANSLNPVIERDLPFKTYYNASMMFLKTEL